MATRGPNQTKTERSYIRQLTKLSKHIQGLVDSYDAINDPADLAHLVESLHYYGLSLRGWARAAGERMVQTAAAREEKFWHELSAHMSKELRREMSSGNLRPAMEEMVREQVEYITSLPDRAALRVTALAMEARTGGKRAEEIERQVAETGQVTASRATLIARTEVARTSARITQARAALVGSEEYIWRTAGDSDVRHGHDEVANKVFRWDNPPAINEGTKEKPRIMHHHPGEIWNCRCYAEPIIPE